jgi:hypothetical protein
MVPSKPELLVESFEYQFGEEWPVANQVMLLGR